MFDRIFDFLARFGVEALPFIVIPVYQNGGVLRFGRYHRTIGPGIHWKIPFVFSRRRLPPKTMSA